MSTTIAKTKKSAVKKNRVNRASTAKKDTTIVPAIVPVIKDGELKNIITGEIDFSPLNYRKFYSHVALDAFATELALHGIINPITVRKMPSGRYELAAGERRLRAARLAELKEVPALIKELTDDEVIEIQLSENLQRENPHPMNEAQGIGMMQRANKTIDEIAARLGKSKTFIYSRIRLLQLIIPVQEMFIADVFNIQQAFDIAALASESQQEFFEQHCTNWETNHNFSINNLNHILSRFKYDLNNAPFNTKDKKLVPEMGACTHCPFNSATLKTLFPELAGKAVCSKKDCYQSKCDANFITFFTKAFKEHQPQALIYEWRLSDISKELLNALPEIAELSKYAKSEITVFETPLYPDKEDFTHAANHHEDEEYDEDSYNEDEDYTNEETYKQEQEPLFDESAYNAAIYEYEADLEEYNRLMESGGLTKGLLVSDRDAVMVMFSMKATTVGNTNKSTITAKEVQEAIKVGNATPELLQAEIDRMNSREVRAKELDREKVQENIHSAFMKDIEDVDNNLSLTDADLVAARLVVYQSLNWDAARKVNTALFSEKAVDEKGEKLPFYEVLQKLTDQQYSYLIRMAIGCKSDGKAPNNSTGEIVYRVAESAGVDVAGFELKQQEKADTRHDKLTVRIAELEQKIKKLQAKAGLEI